MKTDKPRSKLQDLPAKPLMRAPLTTSQLRLVAGGMCIEFGTHDQARGVSRVDYQCWNEP